MFDDCPEPEAENLQETGDMFFYAAIDGDFDEDLDDVIDALLRLDTASIESAAEDPGRALDEAEQALYETMLTAGPFRAAIIECGEDPDAYPIVDLLPLYLRTATNLMRRLPRALAADLAAWGVIGDPPLEPSAVTEPSGSPADAPLAALERALCRLPKREREEITRRHRIEDPLP